MFFRFGMTHIVSGLRVMPSIIIFHQHHITMATTIMHLVNVDPMFKILKTDILNMQEWELQSFA